MPGIGADIKEVIDEMGVLVTVLRDGGNFTEKITSDPNAESSNPFLREFHSITSFSYDTRIECGDLLQWNGTTHLVINKAGDTFEGETVEFVGGLYRCNFPAGASILYLQNTKNEDRTITAQWLPRVATAYGLVYQDSRTVTKNPDMSPGKETAFSLVCYVPASYGVQVGDRIVISPSLYFRVQDVEPFSIIGVYILTLVEDDRKPHV